MVRQVTPEQLREFHARTFRPDATTLAVVGDFQTSDMLAELERIFGSWAHPATPLAVKEVPDPARQDADRKVRKTMDKNCIKARVREYNFFE